MLFVQILLVGLLGAFTQSLSGFGGALVAMAFLPDLLGMQAAIPLVSIFSLTIEGLLLARYHAQLRLENIWQIILASALGVPIGILALKQVEEQLAMTLLGLVISGYAIYSLVQLHLPDLRHPAWGWGAGLMAGMLGGAFNTSGPPVVIYAHARRWPPLEFKGNLQGFFVINSLLVVVGHLVSGHYTPAVLQNYLWALPGLLLGLLSGASLDRLIPPDAFRKLVLILLIFMGLQMIF